MVQDLVNPGDVLEGEGYLLFQGRLVTGVAYHLTVPTQFHFFTNPTHDYKERIGGFILVTPEVAPTLSLTEYTLELANKIKKTIWIERRYKEVQYQGQKRISFWVKVVEPS